MTSYSKRSLLLLAFVGLLTFSGCLEVIDKITIRQNGTAQVVRSVGVPSWLMSMADEFGKAGKSKDTDEEKPKRKSKKKSKKKKEESASIEEPKEKSPFANMDSTLFAEFEESLSLVRALDLADTTWTATKKEGGTIYYKAYIELEDYNKIPRLFQVMDKKAEDSKSKNNPISSGKRSFEFIEHGDSIQFVISGAFSGDDSTLKSINDAFSGLKDSKEPQQEPDIDIEAPKYLGDHPLAGGTDAALDSLASSMAGLTSSIMESFNISVQFNAPEILSHDTNGELEGNTFTWQYTVADLMKPEKKGTQLYTWFRKPRGN